VSDEFTVRGRRVHHRELHRSGNEAAWRQRLNIDPLPVALRLWQHTRAEGEFTRSAESTTQVHAAKTPDMSSSRSSRPEPRCTRRSRERCSKKCRPARGRMTSICLILTASNETNDTMLIPRNEPHRQDMGPTARQPEPGIGALAPRISQVASFEEPTHWRALVAHQLFARDDLGHLNVTNSCT
jgi:hypothetical protein